MSAVSDRKVTVWQNKIGANVKVSGDGPPLVFLHGAGGLMWDPFLDMLAANHTVYAPEHPGTTLGDPDAISHLDNLWDLVLYYDEVLDALGIAEAPIVGHSFGGMMAAEIAASHPGRVSKLVLMSPIGLWRDDVPIPNWMLVSPASDIAKLLLYDPDGPLGQMMFGGAPDPDAQVAMMWCMACTGKFVWPIPDKGLKKRIHRIKAPTLVLWGKDDRLVPAAYAQEFASRIPGAKVELLDQTGHLLQGERPAQVAALIEEFM
jgi:pimeloyl-ACP methyl ester carboxylesterase